MLSRLSSTLVAFSDYQNTFKTTGEPDYLEPIKNNAAVGVLQPEEWFDWDDEAKL
jgi:fatty acid synthase subunit alpha, fungi type